MEESEKPQGDLSADTDFYIIKCQKRTGRGTNLRKALASSADLDNLVIVDAKIAAGRN